jgi:hypothetical protein
MMGGDPGLSKHLNTDEKVRFWVHIGNSDAVIVVRAASKEKLAEKFPQLQVFEPGTNWEVGHRGELFREYDIEKDLEELQERLSQAG